LPVMAKRNLCHKERTGNSSGCYPVSNIEN
jgi:hypothetical protein